jgi:3-phenylpropionate/cinnamic acid dioxygenase small subunit
VNEPTALAAVRAAYDSLFATVRMWNGAPRCDPAAIGTASSLVHHEARLLDDGALGEWLALWHVDSLSWLPLRAGVHPADDQSFYLDDARRRRERVDWMRSPDAWSQSPEVRTVRTIGSVEGRFTGQGDLYVRSAFHLAELRLPPVRQWFGHLYHRFVLDATSATGWLLVHKIIVVPQLAQTAEHPGLVL